MGWACLAIAMAGSACHWMVRGSSCFWCCLHADMRPLCCSLFSPGHEVLGSEDAPSGIVHTLPCSSTNWLIQQ